MVILIYKYVKLKSKKRYSKFYRGYYELIFKFQVGIKSLLRQGLLESELYGDLVYKFEKIVGSNNFSAQFIKRISYYKKSGYDIDVLQQGQHSGGWQLCFPLKLHASESDFRQYDVSNLN